MKRLLQIAAIALALAGGGAAQAATLGLAPVSAPQLTASGVSVDNDPDLFESLFASGSGAAFNGSGSYAFTVNLFYESILGPEEGTLDIFDGFDLVYTGSMIARGFVEDRIELLFGTALDTLGIGSQALVFLTGSFGAGDLFANTFSVPDASATIAAPIPLPLSGILLLSGVGGMLLVARRRRLAA